MTTASGRSRARNVLIALGLIGVVGAGLYAQAGSHEGHAARGTVTDASAGLDEYLVRKRAALFLSQTRPAEPVTLHARATAESRSGVRRLRIRDFQFLSDSDRSFAGYNLGAGSWDTEGGVLAGAVADEFTIQAAARGIPLEAIDVVFTSHQDGGGTELISAPRVAYPRNLRYTAYIVSTATDAELEELRTTVERVSPVLHLVGQPQAIPEGKLFYTPSPAVADPNAPPGLRDFLVEKRAAVLRRQERAAQRTASSSSSSPSLLRAHATVEGRTGLRHIRTGDSRFQFIHDSPRDCAGYDIGPTAEEHQIGVLATCLTHIFEVQAATRQVVLDSLEVRVEGTLTPRIGAGTDNPPRYRDIRYSVHIESPESAQKIDDLRKAVEAVCPIYNLLKDSQPIEGRIVRARYTPGG